MKFKHFNSMFSEAQKLSRKEFLIQYIENPNTTEEELEHLYILSKEKYLKLIIKEISAQFKTPSLIENLLLDSVRKASGNFDEKLEGLEQLKSVGIITNQFLANGRQNVFSSLSLVNPFTTSLVEILAPLEGKGNLFGQKAMAMGRGEIMMALLIYLILMILSWG